MGDDFSTRRTLRDERSKVNAYLSFHRAVLTFRPPILTFRPVQNRHLRHLASLSMKWGDPLGPQVNRQVGRRRARSGLGKEPHGCLLALCDQVGGLRPRESEKSFAIANRVNRSPREKVLQEVRFSAPLPQTPIPGIGSNRVPPRPPWDRTGANAESRPPLSRYRRIRA